MYANNPLIQQATQWAFTHGAHRHGLGKISLWQHGLSIADSLLHLHADAELLSAALLYPFVQHDPATQKALAEFFPTKILQLVEGAHRMESIRLVHNSHRQNAVQVENCRKMLLAMADDLRVVLLKIAERLHALRTARFLEKSEEKNLGEEISRLYAPLANRLGLGQMKWEMEDLAFRINHSAEYKNIANALDMKRTERDNLIHSVLSILDEEIRTTGITHFELMGRPKHIYSIHRKMTKKNVGIHELFDISAVRVLVDSIEDCYRVLDIVQQRFEMIQKEFDDYISVPKPNGYRSIHTAVYGPDRHIVEIQIRTFTMHQESELGVAAHWRYKEGGQSNQSYEAKIAWLREVLSWQNEVDKVDKAENHLLAERVYAFTPQGDILDLALGSTVLDFAYMVHTNVGHRCRGAKINGHIVPLTTKLRMGDRVDIMTGKTPNPSPDWVKPQLGYLFGNRARQKAAQWLRQKNHDAYLVDGKNTLERELKRLNLSEIDHQSVCKKFEYADKESLYVAIGAGEIRASQLSGRLDQWYKQAPPVTKSKKVVEPKAGGAPSLVIEGDSQLLTHLARCCQPKAGDDIAAYISSRRGVSIHKTNCASFLARKALKPAQVLQARWS